MTDAFIGYTRVISLREFLALAKKVRVHLGSGWTVKLGEHCISARHNDGRRSTCCLRQKDVQTIDDLAEWFARVARLGGRR